MKHVIHVNQHNIKSNITKGTDLPVITVKNYKENRYANNVTIYDKKGNVLLVVKYSPEKPLACGARVWIETDQNIELTL